jgi:hypothetical protein
VWRVGGAPATGRVVELVGVTGAGFTAAQEGARLVGGLIVQALAEQMEVFVKFVEQQLRLFGGGGGHAALHLVQTAADDGEAFLDELMKRGPALHGGHSGRRGGSGFLGCVGPFVVAVGDFTAEDANVFRRGNAEPDDPFFDAHHLDGGFQAREDERFVLTPRQNEHDNPFTKQWR